MRAVPLLVVAGLLVVVAPSLAQGPTGMTVDTEPVDDVDVNTIEYPVLDGSGEEVGTNTWRVVQGTGNCCESYLDSTPDGRLLDFGGTYLHVSEDAGQTWERVQTPAPYVGGEGAVSAAPGGDVVAVGWAPYSGDQLWAHKYEADEEQWYYASIPVHTPFHDRPWVAVVPGPIETETDEAEYAVLVDGWPNHEAVMASLDGLHYDEPTNQHTPLDGDGNLTVTPDPVLDWVQAHRRAEVAALGAGQALGPSTFSCGDGQGAVMDEDLTWRCRETEVPVRRTVTDSRGRLHNVDADGGDATITYRVSDDDGATWRSVDVALPGDLELDADDAFDLAAHGSLGQAALAVHAWNASDETHQDLLLRFDIQQDEPELLEIDVIGVGGFEFGSSAASTAPRLDFVSTAILPDGRVAVSFKDADHVDEAAVAIEPEASTLEPTEPATNGTSGEDPNATLRPPNARFTVDATGLRVHADGTASWDPDGEVVRHAWDFGDGATATGAHANHTYAEPGTYTVTLTVEDDDGRTSQAESLVEPDGEPLDPASEEDDGRGIPGAGPLVALAVALAAVARNLRDPT